jgi:hypothetical protein
MTEPEPDEQAPDVWEEHPDEPISGMALTPRQLSDFVMSLTSRVEVVDGLEVTTYSDPPLLPDVHPVLSGERFARAVTPSPEERAAERSMISKLVAGARAREERRDRGS